MAMNFKNAAKLSSFLSKDYAEKIFRLIVMYSDISASEAASRLGLHIRTVQDFLDAMHEFDIIEKKEVYERKRPYNRYSLKKNKIEIVIDLEEEFDNNEVNHENFRIRESAGAGAKFSIARNGEYFSSVTTWMGEGRRVKERKINLTTSQGKFLFHLPFPDAEPLAVDEIIKKAEIDPMNRAEITDIVDELQNLRVIEKIH